jgi:hypothetical protein
VSSGLHFTVWLLKRDGDETERRARRGVELPLMHAVMMPCQVELASRWRSTAVFGWCRGVDELGKRSIAPGCRRQRGAEDSFIRVLHGYRSRLAQKGPSDRSSVSLSWPSTDNGRKRSFSVVAAKAGLTFPVARMKRYWKKGHYANRVGSGENFILRAGATL